MSVTGVTLTPGDTTVVTSWDDTAGAAGYTVEWQLVEENPPVRDGPSMDFSFEPRTPGPGETRIPYRLRVIDYRGIEYAAELENAHISRVTWPVSGYGTLNFTMPGNDPKLASITGKVREVQLWHGSQVIWWGVVVRMRGDGREVDVQCVDLSWYLSRRVVGRVPIRNLLRNGSFEDGLDHWGFDHRQGSIPPRPPTRSVSTFSLNGSRSLRLGGTAFVTTTTSETVNTLAGDVTFNFDQDTLKAGAGATIDGIAANIPTGASVRVIGHTDSNASHAYNQDLSERRANTVRSRIIGARPTLSVTASGKGETQPVATNSTSAGRAANRRVEIRHSVTRTETVTATGHRQYAWQRVTYTNPVADRISKILTVSAWVYIDNFTTPAKDGWGLYLERLNPDGSTISEDSITEANSLFGVRVSTAVAQPRAFASIDFETPQDRWVRLECSVEVPADGKAYQVAVRLFPPGGTCWWDEVTLTASDALTFFDMDQAAIMKGLVEHAQSSAMAKSTLNIGTSAPSTGVKRTKIYPWSERMTILEALDDFASLLNGAEHSIEWAGSSRYLRVWYPRRGQDSSVVLSWRDNIVSFPVDVDGEATASRIIVQAQGEGSDREEGVATDTSLLDGLLLESVYSAEPEAPVSTLESQAMQGLRRYSKPVTIPSITMDPRLTDQLLQKVRVGDRCQVVIDYGWVSINARYRVVEIDLIPHTNVMTYSIIPEG